MVDWNDLRFFLALQRTGKLLSAARQLHTTHATVARHIEALQAAIGQPLFVQHSGGFVLTDAGRQLLPLAESMENTVSTMLEATRRDVADVSGQVRLGAPEGLGSMFLSRYLPKLLQKYPSLQIDLISVPRFVSITNHEADITITLERPQANLVITRKLTDYHLGLYASPAYLASHAPIQDKEGLSGHAILGYVDDLLFSRELMFHQGLCRQPVLPLRSTSVVAQWQAAIEGGGIAVLPCYMVQNKQTLNTVLPGFHLTRSYWISARRDIRKTLRYRVVWDFLVELCQQQREQLLPEPS